MINRLRSYKNGVHGDFFLEVADTIESLTRQREVLADGLRGIAQRQTCDVFVEVEHCKLPRVPIVARQALADTGMEEKNEM